MDLSDGSEEFSPALNNLELTHFVAESLTYEIKVRMIGHHMAVLS